MKTILKILILSVLTLASTTACTTMVMGGGGHAHGNMHSSADADIINQVNRALVNDSRISATDIRVSSSNGVVTLSGEVASHELADRAIHLVRLVQGVESVKSELHVRDK